VTISPAATPATPQAPTALAGSSGNLAATGFSEALLRAAAGDPASSLDPSLPPGNRSLTVAPLNAQQSRDNEGAVSFLVSPGAPGRGVKNIRQQPKEDQQRANAAPVAAALPAAPALPLHIQAFSRDLQDHDGQSASDFGSNPLARAAGADSVPEASNSQAPERPAPAPAGDLAFAARVQPPAPVPVPASARPLQPETATPVQLSSKKTTESEAADPIVVKAIDSSAGASFTSYGHTSANSEVPSPSPDSQAAPPKAVEAGLPVQPQPQPKSAADPLKDISLQVSQPGAPKVEVRMVQQSGELHVAVRTGDSDLAHGLQQGLSDLVGRLQENGFRTEAWRPGATVPSTPVFESRNSQGSSQNGHAPSHSGNPHQQEGERRQQHSTRPAWVEELENSTSSEQSQGATYGISN